jgi:cobalt-zinc-cadmium efflux system outer membrane protein
LLSVCFASSALAIGNPSPAGDAGQQPQTLTLSEVLARTWHEHPELAAAQAAAAAGRASALQAGRLANPELSLEVENFAGSGDGLGGFDGAETTLRLDQPLQLGGKGRKRQALAEAERDITLRQGELTRAELYVQTVELFYTQLAAQQRLQLAESRLQGATRTVESIAAQIDAGKVPAVAALRSRPLLVEARLEQVRAAAALAAARSALAAHLGELETDSLTVSGELQVMAQPAAPQQTAVAPQLSLAAAERARAGRALALERAQVIPDLTVGLGLRQFEASGERALVAGISVPLPLFDRNGSGVAAASARLEEARQKERGAAQRFAVASAAAEEEVAGARSEALALQEELLPAAREVFAAIDYGYRAGKFGLLELLDAQRQLDEVELRLLTAQVACQVAMARRDALYGRFPLLEGSANLEEQ